MTRVAAIDCGTNSVRLLIADIRSEARNGGAAVAGGSGGSSPQPGTDIRGEARNGGAAVAGGSGGSSPQPGTDIRGEAKIGGAAVAGGSEQAGGRPLVDVERRMEIVRLGEGVDRTGRLAPEALERTFAAMRGYAALIERHGAEKVRVVATSATRDASNRADFVAGVMEIFGVVPEVITGDEEARLSFLGATRELAELRPARPYLVVDIGGGSTEFVLGSSSVQAARSVDIGCVRMTERHLKDGDPPSPELIADAIIDIDAALATVRETVPVDEARTLVGLAGSVTTVAGMAMDLPAYDPERIHLSRITALQVHEVTRGLLHATRAERAEVGVMHPGRVDVIGAGALILDRIMREYGFGAVVVSEHDILDGIAWSLV